MLIINAKDGQLSNRMIALANGLSYAIENDEKVFVTSFDDEKDHYLCASDILNKDRISIRKNLLADLEWFVRKVFIKFLKIEISPLNIGGICFSSRCNLSSDFIKYSDEIRSFFTPKPESIAYSLELFQKINNKYSKIIGVHIRRGDYKEYENGRNYFEDDIYLRNILSIEKQLQDENILFILFSNEPIEEDNYKEVKNLLVSHGSKYDDHWLMSKCDYLIGPPSSFTRWASFMGEVPVVYIEGKDDIVSLKKAQIYEIP